MWRESTLGGVGRAKLLRAGDTAANALETLAVTHLARAAEAILVVLSVTGAAAAAGTWTDTHQSTAGVAEGMGGQQPPVNRFYAFTRGAAEWSFTGLTPERLAAMTGDVQHLLALAQVLRIGVAQARTSYTALLLWLRLLLRHWTARRDGAAAVEAEEAAGAPPPGSTDAAAAARRKRGIVRGVWPAPADFDLVRAMLQPACVPPAASGGGSDGAAAAGGGGNDDPLGPGLHAPPPPAARGRGGGAAAAPPPPPPPAPRPPLFPPPLRGAPPRGPGPPLCAPMAAYADFQAAASTRELDAELSRPPSTAPSLAAQVVAGAGRQRAYIIRLKRRLQPPLSSFSSPPIQIDVPILPGLTASHAAAMMHAMSYGTAAWFDDDTSWLPPAPPADDVAALVRLVKSAPPPATPGAATVPAAAPVTGEAALLSPAPAAAAAAAASGAPWASPAAFLSPGGPGSRAPATTAGAAAAAATTPAKLPLLRGPAGEAAASAYGAAVRDAPRGAVWDAWDPALWLHGSHVTALPLPAPLAGLASAGAVTVDALLLLRVAAIMIEPGSSRMWWKRIAGVWIALPPGTTVLATAFYGALPGAAEVAVAAAAAAGAGLAAPPAAAGAGRASLLAVLHAAAPLPATTLVQLPYRELPWGLLPPQAPDRKPQPGTEVLATLPVVSLNDLPLRRRTVPTVEGVGAPPAGDVPTPPLARLSVDVIAAARAAASLRLEACGSRGAAALVYGGTRVVVVDIEDDADDDADGADEDGAADTEPAE